MTDVHLPRIRESHSAWRLALEVTLIALGVFLGLMGEQWRESRSRREMALTALRSFQTELRANKAAVARVAGYHVALQKRIGGYLGSTQPKTLQTFAATGKFEGMQPVQFERTAYDLALATESLAYVDADLRLHIARVYTRQQSFQDLENQMSGALFAPGALTDGFASLLTAASIYLNDVTATEPALVKMYDDVLPQIDAALK